MEKCFAFAVEGLAPQYETGANATEARDKLIQKLLLGNDLFGPISEGMEVK
jgi:hypothetical protein